MFNQRRLLLRRTLLRSHRKDHRNIPRCPEIEFALGIRHAEAEPSDGVLAVRVLLAENHPQRPRTDLQWLPIDRTAEDRRLRLPDPVRINPPAVRVRTDTAIDCLGNFKLPLLRRRRGFAESNRHRSRVRRARRSPCRLNLAQHKVSNLVAARPLRRKRIVRQSFQPDPAESGQRSRQRQREILLPGLPNRKVASIRLPH